MVWIGRGTTLRVMVLVLVAWWGRVSGGGGYGDGMYGGGSIWRCGVAWV